MIAGFDPSITHFGWVIFDENKSGKGAVSEAGVFGTSPSDGLMVQRLIMQRERLRLFLTKKNIKFVAMEAPFWGDYSTELLYAHNQFLHEVFLELGIFVVYFQPGAWKKLVFPDMKADEVSKGFTTHFVKKELDRQGKRLNEHVADAYCVGKVGLRFYQWYILHKFKDDGLTEHEYECFCGKHTYVKGEKKGMTEYTGIIYRENSQFWDYSKHSRKTAEIIKELSSGGKNTESGRIL